MKKYLIAGLTLMVLASMLVGCGCTNQNMTPTTIPTTTPVPSTSMTTEPTTRATTLPTTAPTTTAPHGNGGLDNTTGVTEGTGATSGTSGATDGDTTSPQRSLPNGR